MHKISIFLLFLFKKPHWLGTMTTSDKLPMMLDPSGHIFHVARFISNEFYVAV